MKKRDKKFVRNVKGKVTTRTDELFVDELSVTDLATPHVQIFATTIDPAAPHRKVKYSYGRGHVRQIKSIKSGIIIDMDKPSKDPNTEFEIEYIPRSSGKVAHTISIEKLLSLDIHSSKRYSDSETKKGTNK